MESHGPMKSCNGYPGRSILLAVLILATTAGGIPAQDAHYWNLQYGNRARLLGGAVIGSVLDVSAVYYNPGALSLTESKGLLLAGNVFELRTLTWEDALGPGRDLGDTKFGGVPSLFAGEFRLGFLGDHRLAYSFLTRQTFNVRLTATGISADPFPDIPELGTLAANVTIEQDMNEYWGGLTWSHTLGAHLGLGVSTFFAVRNQRTESSTQAELVGTDTEQAIAALQGRAYDFQDWRILWKIGLAAGFEQWELGLNVTTPSVGLWGSGSASSNDAEIAQNVDTSGDPELPRVEVDFQDGVSSSYKSPLAIGAGAAYRFGATKVYASAEWFSRIDPYRVLDTQPFIGQTSGDTLILNVVADAAQVLNWGVGVEHNFNERTGVYGSFATDFSSTAPGSETSASVTFWDLYHASLGTTFTVGQSVWTVGGILGFGGQEIGGIDVIPGDDEIISALEETKLSIVSFTFILGFELEFQ